MQSIILIGYRGTGKTSVAQKLAQRLGLPVFDSDSEIERQAGKTIAEIFAEEGESAFRDLEETVIVEILSHSAPFLLSTGGGAVLRENTRVLLRQSGKVVWLTATPETILRRITSDVASLTMRPNLTSLPMREEVVAVLERRNPLYAETAHEIVNTDSLSIDGIVEMLMQLEKRSQSRPIS